MDAICISPDNIASHISMLADEIGERNISHPYMMRSSAEYISQQWHEIGYDVKRQYFVARDTECVNLEVEHIGNETPNRIILLGAHYDSFSGCPGANDNASGIATLLEISRIITTLNSKCTIRFVALTNEEPPYLGTDAMGSWVYARRSRQRSDNIRAIVLLGTLGYYDDAPASQMAPPILSTIFPKRANFVAMISNLRSMRLSKRFTKAFRQNSTFPCRWVSMSQALPDIGWSAQNAFSINSYKTFMITDTAAYRYPFYHSSRDTSDKINYPATAQVCDGIVKALLALDKQS